LIDFFNATFLLYALITDNHHVAIPADWHLLQDRIRLIPNNSKWISDLKAAKERLIKNVKIVEKNRKQKIKQIQRIHLLNGQMSELVKARIDEINGRRRVKAQIAAALSVEKVSTLYIV
jgi:hypothetical protein